MSVRRSDAPVVWGTGAPDGLRGCRCHMPTSLHSYDPRSRCFTAEPNETSPARPLQFSSFPSDTQLPHSALLRPIGRFERDATFGVQAGCWQASHTRNPSLERRTCDRFNVSSPRVEQRLVPDQFTSPRSRRLSSMTKCNSPWRRRVCLAPGHAPKDHNGRSAHAGVSMRK